MKNFFLLSIAALALFACAKKDDAPQNVDNFPYDGLWKGTYSGADSGIVSITITQDGKLSGTGKSQISLTEFTLDGTVANTGAITASSASTGATFTGNLTENTGSGTWTNGSVSGTWKGTKQ